MGVSEEPPVAPKRIRRRRPKPSAEQRRQRLTTATRRQKDATDQRRQRIRKSRTEERNDGDASRRQNFTESEARAQHGVFETEISLATEEGDASRAGAHRRRQKAPIERYHAREEIDGRQYEAAKQLRDDYEFGICGVRERGLLNLEMKGPASPGFGYSDFQVNAAEAYRRAVNSIGPRVAAVVLPVIIGDEGGADVTVGALAEKLGMDAKVLFGQFRLGLDLLADAYGMA